MLGLDVDSRVILFGRCYVVATTVLARIRLELVLVGERTSLSEMAEPSFLQARPLFVVLFPIHPLGFDPQPQGPFSRGHFSQSIGRLPR